MVEFLQFTLGGISFGMIYAAIALSLVLIWRGTRLLNFAQGGMAMFTTYIAIEVIYHTGSYWAGFAAALAAGIVLGTVAQLVVIRPAQGKPDLNAVIITIGLLVLLEGLAGIFYGGQFRSFPAAFSVTGLRVGSTALGVSRFDVFVAAAVLVTTLLLAVGFRYTSAGLRMRAAAFNATVARLSGIRVARVITVSWALAGLLGALAGVLVSPSTFLYPNSMDSIFVFGFTAAVIGGLDSPVGAVTGGLLLGVVLNIAGGYLGADVTALPQYYKPWDQGLKDLHAQLKKVDEIRYFSDKQKKVFKERMQASGLAVDQPDAIALMGHGPSLLAVIDPASLKIEAILKAT